MDSPSRWLVQSPDGQEHAVADLGRFVDSEEFKGWVVIGETINGSDYQFEKPVKQSQLDDRYPDLFAEIAAEKEAQAEEEAKAQAEADAAAKAEEDAAKRTAAEARAAEAADAKAAADTLNKKKADNAPA
jgi:hypothetical protein